MQFGSRSFVRADENSELALLNQDERYIQFKVTSGRVSFDMRSLAVDDAVEVGTPNAVFTIRHPGYYRVEVDGRDTHFITRRGGEATVTTADGRSLSIYPSEDIVVTAGDPVNVATYAAPAPDAWDRWNGERSDRIRESISARYLPPDMYGVEELDHYGDWRVVPAYGEVWIPSGMSAGWVPYSTGYWVWDPYYEWTWIDDAPWGWAPPPRPPRYDEVRKPVAPPPAVTRERATVRSQTTTREQSAARQEVKPATRPVPPAGLRRQPADLPCLVACRSRGRGPRPRRQAEKRDRTRKSGRCRGNPPARPIGGATAETVTRVERPWKR